MARQKLIHLHGSKPITDAELDGLDIEYGEIVVQHYQPQTVSDENNSDDD